MVEPSTVFKAKRSVASMPSIFVWDESGCGRIDLHLNVSAHQFLIGDVGSSIQSALNRHDIDPGRLVIDIAEIALVDRAPIADAIQALKRLLPEIRVSVDDFGTKYAPMDYLNEIPADIVKIDPVSTSELDTGANRDLVATSQITVNQTLGLSIIAEGVETAENVATLLSKGCRLGQGYHLHPPLAASEISALLKMQARRQS